MEKKRSVQLASKIFEPSAVETRQLDPRRLWDLALLSQTRRKTTPPPPKCFEIKGKGRGADQ